MRALPRIVTVAYVAGAALSAQDGVRRGVWLPLAVAAVLLFVAVRARAAEVRAAAWGAAVVAATVGFDDAGHRALAAAAALGELTCVVAACVAVARARTEEAGVLRVAPASPVAVVAVAVMAWSGTLVADMAPRGHGLAWIVERPAVSLAAAVVVSAVALAASVARASRRGGLDLAIRERVGAMRWLASIAIASTAAVGAFAWASWASMARGAVAAVAVALVWAAVERDAVRVRVVARRAAVLVLFGGPVAVGMAAAVARAPDAGPALVLVAGLVLLALGAGVRRLERPFLPAGGKWIDALARASDAIVLGDPQEVIRHALLALRAPLGLEFPSPALWTAVPPCALRVDAAGYVHEDVAEIPPALAAVAAGEPGATLRAELLDAVQVRRPDLRPLAAWMNDRGALAVTRIECAGEMEAVLVLPRGDRREPMTLEEIRSIKRLADRLGAACRARATELRLLERANLARASAEAAEQRAERIAHQLALEGARNVLAASVLARGAEPGMYAAASRMTIEALERRVHVGAPIALFAPIGVDPIPYLARAHLAGPRRDGPLVVVDGTAPREHDPARWSDPQTSPLALAHGGLLALIDAAALPPAVQDLVARALTEARPPWERPDRLDVQLAVTRVLLPPQAAAEGRLEPALAARLGDALSAPLILPHLHERPEDFRGLLMDRLAREGLRVRGQPVGIEPAAYARLAEYPFPGNEVELAALVQRLVARCRGDRVVAADLDALRVPRSAAMPRESRRRKDPLSA